MIGLMDQGLRDDITILMLKDFKYWHQNCVLWCSVPWRRSLFKMVNLGQFFIVLQNWNFLYVFVPVCTPPPPPAADSCSQDNFWTTFFISFIFWYDCWPWPIEYLIRFWSIFVVTLTLDLQGQKWNLLYLRQKWSDCHETKSKHIDWTLGFKCDHQVWPWSWPYLEFSRSNMEFAISKPKMVRLPQNEKQIHRLHSRPQMWPSGLTFAMTLTLNFQGQIWNLLYLS